MMTMIETTNEAIVDRVIDESNFGWYREAIFAEKGDGRLMVDVYSICNATNEREFRGNAISNDPDLLREDTRRFLDYKEEYLIHI